MADAQKTPQVPGVSAPVADAQEKRLKLMVATTSRGFAGDLQSCIGQCNFRPLVPDDLGAPEGFAGGHSEPRRAFLRAQIATSKVASANATLGTSFRTALELS